MEWETAGNNLSGNLKRLIYKAFALVSREAQGKNCNTIFSLIFSPIHGGYFMGIVRGKSKYFSLSSLIEYLLEK